MNKPAAALISLVDILLLCIQDEDAEMEKFVNAEITESMRLEMEYNSDRAW